MNGISESAIAEPAPLVTESAESASEFWPGFLLGLAATSIVIGILWDISWHISIGRDTFWTPAHMAIYLGGVLSGLVGGWLVLKHTFLARSKASGAAVSVFGLRAPLGAWVALWGALAMLTSAPFDDWWHNAYGLDVKIISPPHAVLGLGMFAISLGAVLLVLARQNRGEKGAGAGLFVYAGGIFLTLGGVFVSEYTFPNLQHTGLFFKVCAGVLPFRLVAFGRAGRLSWSATRIAAVYLGIVCLMIWILPLFPAQTKLAPIFSPVTHMVPPAFPLLLVFPAFAIDLVLRKVAQEVAWWKQLLLAVALGGIFLAVFAVVQWFFAKFMLSSYADNWFFAGGRFYGYGVGTGSWRSRFWRVDPSQGRLNSDVVKVSTFLISWAFASASALVGLLLGNWMRKVKR